jgi:protein SCO1/2
MKGFMNKKNPFWISRFPVVFCGLLQFYTVAIHSAADPDPHAHHRAMMAEQKRYSIVTADYTMPSVTAITSEGVSVELADLLDGDDPVIVSFIFTSCQTICPVLTAILSQAQDGLADASPAPRIVSFSIDPEYDTPARMSDYATSFHAEDNWSFVTGDVASMVQIQRAFDAYRGDKLNHIPLTFMRHADDSSWIRFDGFMSAGDLVKEYQAMLSTAEDS